METVYYLCNFLSRVVATRPNTGSAEGGARAATPSGRRGKRNMEIPVGLTATAVQTPTRK